MDPRTELMQQIGEDRELVGTVRLRDCDWSMSCDGHILALVTPPLDGLRAHDKPLPDVAKLLASTDKVAGVVVSVASLREWAGDYAKAKCEPCNGTGQHECECGHCHECQDCDGAGTGGAEKRPGWMATRPGARQFLLNRTLLARLLATLPADAATVSLHVPSEHERTNLPLRLEAPGWIGALMGLKDDRGDVVGEPFLLLAAAADSGDERPCHEAKESPCTP